MLEITSLSSNSGNAAPRLERALDAPSQRKGTPERALGDRVDLSVAARKYTERAEATRTPEDRIAHLRRQIGADTYLSPDKIDYVVDCLCGEVFGTVPQPHVA